jgi:hypothetical protein
VEDPFSIKESCSFILIHNFQKMISPPGYTPGAARTKILWAAEEIVSSVLIVMFIIEYWFGCTKITWSKDLLAPASAMPVYTVLGNPAFYPLTRWGGLDYIILCLGPMSIITYGIPLVISWIGYKDWYATAIAYVILTIGSVIEWIRGAWFIIVMFDISGFWYSAAYGTVVTNIISEFTIISVFAWTRAVYSIIEFLMIFINKRQGIQDRAEEMKYGINGNF